VNLKKNKSARLFFIYGLFSGLIIGLTLSLLGVPQVIGNSIKTNSLNFEKEIKIDEANRVVTVTVYGALDPKSKTFDKDFERMYAFAIKNIETVINEKGISDCKTGRTLSESEKRAQIIELKKSGSSDLLKAQVIFDSYNKLEYLNNLSVQNYEETQFAENTNDYVLYFDPEEPSGGDFDPNNPPGSDSGGINWPDFPDFPTPKCTSCGGGTGICILGVCGSGGGSVKTCVVEGQTVLLANGNSVFVQDVLVGDKVLSYNLENNTFEEDEITFVKENKPESYFRINNKLELTSGHEIYVIDKGYIEVDDLKVNKDYILDNGNPILVTSKKHIKNNDKVTYTLTVKNNKNLFVNGVLVHNELPVTKIELREVYISFTFNF
jgi:uncharacterized repeat protein (TIGR01451 family)